MRLRSIGLKGRSFLNSILRLQLRLQHLYAAHLAESRETVDWRKSRRKIGPIQRQAMSRALGPLMRRPMQGVGIASRYPMFGPGAQRLRIFQPRSRPSDWRIGKNGFEEVSATRGSVRARRGTPGCLFAALSDLRAEPAA